MSDKHPLRIVFAGTPDFALAPLHGLLAEDFRPLAVFTQPDRRAGRGRKMQAGPVKQAALEANIPVHQPHSLRDPDAFEALKSLQADLIIVVAYGLILPQDVLNLPRHGCWNIHASLLPRWRGAAPIQRAIEAGDKESGVSIMQMEAGLDTGPVLARCPIPIDENETGGSLHDKLTTLGAEALLSCVHKLQRGELAAPIPQSDEGVSYARKLDKTEARIDWSEPALTLQRRIRAFNPWPVAWCDIQGERTRIWSAEMILQAHAQTAGTVLASARAGIDIATGSQVLRLLELQRPGGRRVSAAEYLHARSLPQRLDDTDPGKI
jgi:methionyl-tRNA formyltransferase